MKTIKEQLFSNALVSVQKAAEHPDLLVEGPIEKSKDTNIPIWVLRAKTNDNKTIFLQAIVPSELALLLITFEAANTNASRSFFDGFLNSVQIVV